MTLPTTSEQDVQSNGSTCTTPAQPGATRPPLPSSSALSGFDEPVVPLALTVQETAQVLRLDPRTIRAMVRCGELEGNQKGHTIRVSRSSVLDWLRGKRRVPRSKR